MLLGSFFDWPDIFQFGRALSFSECVRKTRYEISYCTSLLYRKSKFLKLINNQYLQPDSLECHSLQQQKCPAE